MNKRDLVVQVLDATSNKYTSKAVEEIITATFDKISTAVSKDDPVQLIGFGSFKRVHRKEREGHNPKTGEKIKIPAQNSVNFKVGKSFKDLVNK